MNYYIKPGESISSSGDNPTDDLMINLLEEIQSRYDFIEQSKALLENAPLEEEFELEEGQEFNGLEKLRNMSRNNYAKLIVSATTDRLGILGFRTALAQDESGDKEAASLFDRDDMAVKGVEAMALAGSYRTSYVLVDQPSSRQKVIPPTNGAVIPDPFGEPIAAVVMVRDRFREQDYATLYVRDVDPETGEATGPVRSFVASREYDNDVLSKAREYNSIKVTNYDSEVPLQRTMTNNWVWWKERTHKVSRIPVTTMSNKDGKNEFEDHIDVINRINHMVLQRVVIATMQAFRQRAVIGNFPDKDPITGAKIDYEEMFASGPAQMWTLPENSTMWESTPPTYQDILEAVKEDRKDLASQTYTPMSYFSDSGSNSAEGAALQRENYISKIEDRRGRFAPRWKRHLSILFESLGDQERADFTSLEVIWKPIQVESLTNRVSGFNSLVGSNVPVNSALRLAMGLTPSEISRIEIERKAEAMNNMMEKAMAGATPLERSSHGQNAVTQAAAASNKPAKELGGK